jgi:hypothetical protein
MSFNKNLRIQIFNILFACLIMSGISDSIASEITGVEVFGSIKARDQVIKSEISKTATFKVLSPASMFDPSQGLLIKDCAVTWEKDNIRMKIVYNYLQEPNYVSPGSMGNTYQPIDYDKDKRLIVWRVLEEYIISTPEKTEILDKAQLLYVYPNGNVEKSAGSHTTKHIFPANSKTEENSDFKFFLLAAGLSFSGYIDVNSMSLVEIPNGYLMEISTRGKFGKDTRGTWRLTVDPNSNFSVREASFTVEGNDRESIKVSTFGIVKKDGIEYAREGHIVFNVPFVREYADIDISVRNDQELRQEVNQHMEEPLAPGSQIIDFGGEKPTSITVK